ncbi:phospho-N-acetylmuramoyl-pentapeptide-transferase [Salisediminibacterium beveridgei]|uniref:Phospho-N-acetylmuramoyl-pentapeptide-transferase n=1 Tax=Salisediminibacterium beveridgei TaxID=632773 RepID=A0A1D7QW94_9BACI|nr:phospho-N-acetylmuramoyl-pentapeptide-transferase [Salisediminibacterium beveridgei]AOM83276.1 Phospho-N-acetylmuramoyl-pentapeptide-transferase [Salisediminibacterium beveridgei]
MLQDGLIISLVAAFLFTAFLSPVYIPYLRKLKFGQSIREEGPEWHQKKSGTPTMGGLMFLTAILIVALIVSSIFQLLSAEIVVLLIVTVSFGAVGFIDDYIKVVKKRNLGLTSKQKLLGQIVISAVVYAILLTTDFDTAVSVPATGIDIEFGWFYFILLLFMLVGTSNAVNLTDGLDGLVAGSSVISFLAFAWIAYSMGMNDVALFAMTVTGAMAAFLLVNVHPAKIFMGDTGSLALGGGLAMLAVITKTELLLIVIGGVFVIETLSVILQVASFKLRGKRIFKMSPIHHHFEMSGWSEWRVVIVFWAAGLLFAITGVWIEVWL